MNDATSSDCIPGFIDWTISASHRLADVFSTVSMSLQLIESTPRQMAAL
jgi:hypothetical protein